MTHELFLSHDHRDEPLAKALARLLERLSLNQLQIWFSSDASPGGGIKPGGVWIDEIRTRLRQSKAILALLTPRSIERPWLLFESGFGAGLAGCEVIPVCIGLTSTSAIPFPLAIYQSYIFTDLESLKRFSGKLLAQYGIPYDEEMMEPVLRRAISDFVIASPVSDETRARKELSSQEMLDAIKLHLDRRLGEFVAASKGSGDHAALTENGNGDVLHEVLLFVSIPGLAANYHTIQIADALSVQDILDKIYYIISPVVASFMYLQTWILRERSSGLNLIIREVAHLVPASSVFHAGTSWEVIPLNKPYEIRDSGDPRKWYRRPLFSGQ